MTEETISDGRYGYHLQDIAEIEAMSKPLDPVHQMRLDIMKEEVAEYEAAHPDKVVSAKSSETINILETVCYPKGCMINEEMQLMMAMVLVPRLREAGMTTSEWTLGAALLEEPHLTKVKSVVCRGCNLKLCPHNGKYSPIAEDDPLRTVFHIPYGNRMDFNREVLDQILPEDEVRKLEEDGLKVFKWMSSSRNQIHITVKVGDQSIRYAANLRQKRTDFTVNSEERPVPTSIADICTAVKEVTENVRA